MKSLYPVTAIVSAEVEKYQRTCKIEAEWSVSLSSFLASFLRTIGLPFLGRNTVMESVDPPDDVVDVGELSCCDAFPFFGSIMRDDW